jgi:2-methylcitrate dehydratase PrpD
MTLKKHVTLNLPSVTKMTEETLSEKIARHNTALQLSQIPAAIVETARLHILDSLGCLLAGSRLEAGRLAYDLAAAHAHPMCTSTLLGTNARVPLLDAVQAMSVAAHCGEMDDIHSGAGICIGGMIIPALVAMAENYHGSGRSFLEAVIVGYETTVRVGLSINAVSLFSRGWWPSTICGAFGVAAAGVKFLGWPAERAVDALGIASLHAGGMITGGNEGATARHLVFGRAAQSGMLSLLAAEQGFTGPKRAFEDPRGFCLTLCAEPKWEYLRAFELSCLPNVAFKPYPCARQLHAGVEALLHLINKHEVAPEQIEGIELSVPTPNATMVNRPGVPTHRAATLGSGQYVMAVTALRGKIDLASFEEKFLLSHQVRQLMSKIQVKGEVELDRRFPQYWPGRVTLKLFDGRSWMHEVIIPKGEAGNPMSAEEIEEKFLSLAGPHLGDDKARSVIREVQSLERRPALQPLIASLQLSS